MYSIPKPTRPLTTATAMILIGATLSMNLPDDTLTRIIEMAASVKKKPEFETPSVVPYTPTKNIPNPNDVAMNIMGIVPGIAFGSKMESRIL